MAQFVSGEARRLISFLAVCARATCCMQHLSRQRSLPPQSIFVPLQLELQLHLRHSLQVRHLPHLIPKQRGPFWGQCSMYKHAYVCVYVHMYICTARMSVCITPTSATIISWTLLCIFLLLFGFVLFCGGTKILLYAFGALAICFKQICLNISRIFRQNVQLSSCVYTPHMHTHTYICIHSCCLGPR